MAIVTPNKLNIPKKPDPRTECVTGVEFLTPGIAQTPDLPLFAGVRGRVSAWPQCCGGGIVDSVGGAPLQRIDLGRKIHDDLGTTGEQIKKRWDEHLVERDLTKITDTSTLQDIQRITDFTGWCSIPEEIALAYLLEKLVLKADNKPIDGPFYGGEHFSVKVWGLIDSYHQPKVWPSLLSFRVNTLIRFLVDNPQFTLQQSLLRDLPASYGNHYLQSMTFTPRLKRLEPWVEVRRQAMVAQVKRVQTYKVKQFPTAKQVKPLGKLTQELNKSW